MTLVMVTHQTGMAGLPVTPIIQVTMHWAEPPKIATPTAQAIDIPVDRTLDGSNSGKATIAAPERKAVSRAKMKVAPIRAPGDLASIRKAKAGTASEADKTRVISITGLAAVAVGQGTADQSEGERHDAHGHSGAHGHRR